MKLKLIELKERNTQSKANLLMCVFFGKHCCFPGKEMLAVLTVLSALFREYSNAMKMFNSLYFRVTQQWQR